MRNSELRRLPLDRPVELGPGPSEVRLFLNFASSFNTANSLHNVSDLKLIKDALVRNHLNSLNISNKENTNVSVLVLHLTLFHKAVTDQQVSKPNYLILPDCLGQVQVT